MKHPIVFLSILWLLSSSLCAEAEEKRNKNLSYITILVGRGEIKELLINNNPLVLSKLEDNKVIKQMEVMLFPGDIISVKATAKKGSKGGIFASIKYVDENNNQITINTNKDKWVCDKAVPAEEETKNAKFIWGPTYQEETICEVQIPCKGKDSSSSNDETKSNLRKETKQTSQPESKTTSKTEDKPTVKPAPTPAPEPTPAPTPAPSTPKPEHSDPTPAAKKEDTSSKKEETTKITKKKQPTIAPTPSPEPAYHRTSTGALWAEYQGHKWFCNDRHRAYRKVQGGKPLCLTRAGSKMCSVFHNPEECIQFVISKVKKDIVQYDYFF